MRLIDADALKGYIDCGHLRPPTDLCFSELDVCNMIDKAPTIGGWIPCSERLPSEEDCPMDCMVTRRGKFMGNYVDMAVAERNGTWTHEDWTAIVLGDVESGRKTGLISTRDDEIIAWMPLPEPFKPDAI
jgi:hypothetical protein